MSADIVGAGRAAGHACWVELQLFAALGRWITEVDEPAIQQMLVRHAQHHSWHADLWRGRLPELAEFPPDELTIPRNHHVESLLHELAVADESTTTAMRLVGVYRVVLPRLATEYHTNLGATSALTDGPTARVLQLCLTDVLADWREGEAALQALIDSPEAAADAGSRLGALESLAVAAGSLTS